MPGSAAIGNLAVNLSLETAAFTAGATRAQGRMRALTGEARSMSRGIGAAGAGAGMARFQMLELSHVATSLSGALASGMNPLRAFAMEMPRIAQAATLGGTGFLGMAAAVGRMIAPFAGLAAVAAVLGIALLGVKQSVADDADMQKFIGTLGLTDKEIKKLKDTTVTWGDVTKATFQVLAEKAGTSSQQISGFFSSAFQSIGSFGKFSVAVLLGAFGGMVQGVKDIITNLPAIVGGGIAAAANLGIAALEKMVNLGIAGLNRLSGTINGVLGTSFGQVAQVSLGRVEANFSGTMKAIGSDVSGTFHRIFNSTQATFDQISARATGIAQQRIRAQADEIRGDDASAASNRRAAAARRDHVKAIKEETDAFAGLSGVVDAFDTKHPAKLIGADLKSILPDLPDVAAQVEKQQAQMMHWADAFSGAITDAVTGTKSLKDAFSELANSIIRDLIQMSVRMLIFRALAGIFKVPTAGASDLGGSSLFGGGDLGGLPGFAQGGSGTFGGFGGVDSNILSLNGSPIARVSRGEHFNVSNDNASGGITINQTFAPNFAGNAATHEDLVRMATMTRASTLEAVRQGNRRR